MGLRRFDSIRRCLVTPSGRMSESSAFSFGVPVIAFRDYHGAFRADARVDQTFPLLDAHRIGAALPAGWRERLHVRGEVGSTQAELLAAAARWPDRSVVVSDRQQGGRGRRGRGWHSPPGQSLALSLFVRSRTGARWPSSLTLALGVAAAEALHRAGACGIGLKWPNDLVHDGAKLGGILVESCAEGVVAGIGINLSLNQSARAAIGQPCTDLAAAGCRIERETLAAALILAWNAAFDEVLAGRVEALLAAWAGLDALAGRRVRVESGGTPLEGIARGIDAHGRLLLDVAGECRAFTSADVSVRPA